MAKPIVPPHCAAYGGDIVQVQGGSSGPPERGCEKVFQSRRRKKRFMADTHNMFGTFASEDEDKGPPGLTDSESEEEASARQKVRKSRWCRRRSVHWKSQP